MNWLEMSCVGELEVDGEAQIKGVLEWDKLWLTGEEMLLGMLEQCGTETEWLDTVSEGDGKEKSDDIEFGTDSTEPELGILSYGREGTWIGEAEVNN